MKDIICLLSADTLVFAAKDEVNPRCSCADTCGDSNASASFDAKSAASFAHGGSSTSPTFAPAKAENSFLSARAVPYQNLWWPCKMAAFFNITTHHGLRNDAICALACGLRSPMLPCKEAMHSHPVLSQPPGRDASPDVRSPKSTPSALTRNKWSEE